MFITSSTDNGITYFYVSKTERNGSIVKRVNLVFLGTDFNVPKEKWKQLIISALDVLNNQQVLFPLDNGCGERFKYWAEFIASKLSELQLSNNRLESETNSEIGQENDSFDINKLRIIKSTPSGVAIISLWALMCFGFADIFKRLGFNFEQLCTVLALIASRMERPASEESTFNWLESHSSIGKLLGINFSNKSVKSLHSGCVAIYKNKNRIEYESFSYNNNIFDQSTHHLFYDLTNTFFEGSPQSSKAKYGRSKEKRSDCKLISIGVVSDYLGYIRKSVILDGNISEPKTLQSMIKELNPNNGSILIMDRGIATDENIAWILDNGYNYIVANRHRIRKDVPDDSDKINTKSKKIISVYKEEKSNQSNNMQITESLVFCHSTDRQATEDSINARYKAKFESGLNKLIESIGDNGKIPRDTTNQFIGALKKECKVSQHYKIKLVKSECEEYYIAISYEFQPVNNSKMSHSGVYCLRTNMLQLKATEVWETYMLLTKIERVFRSLKSMFGLRPIHHRKEENIEAHLFISILAYQCSNWVRNRLKACKINDDWDTIVTKLSTHSLVTINYNSGKRSSDMFMFSELTEDQKQIFNAVGLSSFDDFISKMKSLYSYFNISYKRNDLFSITLS
jgi:hypothetical protein